MLTSPRIIRECPIFSLQWIPHQLFVFKEHTGNVIIRLFQNLNNTPLQIEINIGLLYIFYTFNIFPA